MLSGLFMGSKKTGEIRKDSVYVVGWDEWFAVVVTATSLDVPHHTAQSFFTLDSLSSSRPPSSG